MKTMILGLVAAVLATTQALALPDVVTYAARIENDAGAFNGTIAVTFQLFDARTGGAELWSENVASAIVVDGDLVHDLGSIEPLDDSVIERDDLFLSVTINGDTLEPRAALRAVPYALKAREADSLSGLSADDVATDDEVAAAVAARVVSFAQLQAVPAGFADGVDNDTISAAAVNGGLAVAANAFSIANDGVTLARMADSSVGSAEVVADSLTAADLAANSVGNSELADSAVTGAKISNDTITSLDIAAGAVTSSELATDAVTATKINGNLIAIFSRPAGCGGGLQAGSAACKTVVCNEDVERRNVLSSITEVFSFGVLVGVNSSSVSIVNDVDVQFSSCDGVQCNSAAALTCSVTAAGSLLPTSF